MIEHADLKELQERFDARYKLRDDCDREMDEVSKKLASDATQFAVINTKLSAILWMLGVVGTGLIGFVIKYLFGG